MTALAVLTTANRDDAATVPMKNSTFCLASWMFSSNSCGATATSPNQSVIVSSPYQSRPYASNARIRLPSLVGSASCGSWG